MSKFIIAEEMWFKSNSDIYSKTFLCQEKDSDIHIRVIASPFSNCQIFSISPFENLFTTNGDYKKAKNKINDLRNLCDISKSLCQIDIEYSLFLNIKNHVKIHASMEYINLTSSRMVSVIIKI